MTDLPAGLDPSASHEVAGCGGGASAAVAAAAPGPHSLRTLTPSATAAAARSTNATPLSLPRVGADSPNSGAKSVYTFDDEDEDGDEDYKSLFANNKRTINRAMPSVGLGLDGFSSTGESNVGYASTSGLGPAGDALEVDAKVGRPQSSPPPRSPTPGSLMNGVKEEEDVSLANVDDLPEEGIVDGFAILSFATLEDIEVRLAEVLKNMHLFY